HYRKVIKNMSDTQEMKYKAMKYSVLMSIYYQEDPQHLKISIDSMLNQTQLPDQIVVVKDGALTENLNVILDQYSMAYPDLFSIVLLHENVGLGKALNEGLKYCRNELVARMDADD